MKKKSLSEENSADILEYSEIFNDNPKYNKFLFIKLNNYIETTDSQQCHIDYKISKMTRPYAEFISDRDNISIDYLMKRSIVESYQIPYIEGNISNNYIDKLKTIEKYPLCIYNKQFVFKNNNLKNYKNNTIKLTYQKLDDGKFLYPTNFDQKNLYPEDSTQIFIFGNSHKDNINDIFRELLYELT